MLRTGTLRVWGRHRCFLPAHKRFSTGVTTDHKEIEERNPLEQAQQLESEIEGLKRTYGPTSREVLSTLGEASLLYNITGRFEKALHLLEHQRELFLEENGPTHFEHSSMLHDIAAIHESMRNFDASAETYEKSFDIAFNAVERFNSKPAEDQPHIEVPGELKELKEIDPEMEIQYDPLLAGQLLVSKSASNLGRVLERVGQKFRAVESYSDAAANMADNPLAHSTLNADHPHYCTLLNPFLSAYTGHYFTKNYELMVTEDGKPVLQNSNEELTPEIIERSKEEAEMCVRALEVQEKYIGKEHPAIVTSLANSAWSFLRAGEIEKTENMWNRILSIERRVEGPYSARSATAIASIGIIKYFKRDLEEAERLMNKSIRMKQNFYRKEKLLHVALLQYDLSHIVMQRSRSEAMAILRMCSQELRELPNRVGGRRHAWYQLSLDSLAAFGFGEKVSSHPPVKDYDAAKQPNLYDEGGTRLR